MREKSGTLITGTESDYKRGKFDAEHMQSTFYTDA